ncbi:unnamed protein product [Oppiella nova]|uniref:Uncharacterized protein n=1 Tax=Oppiella nova TaxID=334625 RepID=A0A7R9QU86_9ACAR|nr:unnamed protein product [Oppiella nova]CAG2175841.1 unnamed protein product [Oppiella nova]
MDVNLINRFSIYGKHDGNQKFTASFDMEYVDTQNGTHLHITNEADLELRVYYPDFQYNATDIIFCPTGLHPNNYVMVLDKHTGAVQTYKVDIPSMTYLVFSRVNDSECENSNISCNKPQFLDTIPDSLRKQLEAIMDYSEPGVSGHLLWFNINGRPMYCFTHDNHPLSAQRQLSLRLQPNASLLVRQLIIQNV